MTETFFIRVDLRRSLRSFGWLPLAGLALTAVACADHVLVGHAKTHEEPPAERAEEPADEPSEPGKVVDSGTDGGAGEAGSTSTGTEEHDCSEADAAARAPYEAWHALDNDFGVLAGKTLSGYVEAGPDLVLTIGADHTATLVVGEPPPAPEQNQSYLCENEFEDQYYACEVAYSQPPVPGGSYPLHGAMLEDSRLRVGIQPFVPWDSWCRLQDPHEHEQPDPCFFTTTTNAGFSHSLERCTLDQQEVDCGWLQLVQSGICACTSTECFAAMAGEGDLLDARLNEDEDELVGSFRGATVRLFVETEE